MNYIFILLIKGYEKISFIYNFKINIGISIWFVCFRIVQII